MNIHKSLSKVLSLEGGPKIVIISFEFDTLIMRFSCFFSRFLTPCFLITLLSEQLVINKNIKNIFIKNFMNDNYLTIYNNFISLTTNKKLYRNLKKEDTFSDRLTLFLIHFAFFLKNFKDKEDKKLLQQIYDFNFRQLELSIREIGYGDQTINKKMKEYLNLFHSIVSEIHFWNKLEIFEKNKKISIYFENYENIDYLIEYFDNFNDDLSKMTLNSYIKSVSNI